MRTTVKTISFVAHLLFFCSIVCGDVIIIDGETPATGSELEQGSLLTAFGSITFIGNVAPQYDLDLPSGNAFSTDNGVFTGTSGNQILLASFQFDFDVADVSFIYGGNVGTFSIRALDGLNQQVDSFFQASTSPNQPIGPVTLSGGGIRRIEYRDTEQILVNIDNISIRVAVPEPQSILLLVGSLVITIFRTRTRPYNIRITNPCTNRTGDASKTSE